MLALRLAKISLLYSRLPPLGLKGAPLAAWAVKENRDCSASYFLRQRQMRSNEQPTPEPIQ